MGEIAVSPGHLADPVEEHVHQAQPPRACDDLVATERCVLQECLVVPVERAIPRIGQEVVSSKKESSPVPQAGSAMVLTRFRTNARHHRTDEGAGREILAGPGLGVLGVALQQPLVDVAFYVRAQYHPVRAVDHVDQAEELGRVGDLVLRLGEDLAEHPPSARRACAEA